MLQVFYLDVAFAAVAIHICCKHMFQIVSSVLDVCYNKFFILQVFHEQAREAGTGRGGPAPIGGPMFAREARWAQTVLRSNMGA
jgi:hypothetical protein